VSAVGQNAPGATRRRRAARQRDGLYRPLDWAIVRAPLLPACAGANAAASSAPDSLLPDDPRVRAAVGVASADLAAALARTPPGHRDARRLRGKVLRYVIRMSTRPTPYGLFAGVAIATLGPNTDLAIADRAPRTRTRSDMELLLSFVVDLEHDPAIRPELRVFANSGVVTGGGRAFCPSGPGPAASLRFTDAVRRALELARTPIAQSALHTALEAVRGSTPEKVQQLVAELCEHGFLLFDLRPPLTAADPAAYVLERLKPIPAAAESRARLAGLREQLAAWDALELDERAPAWPSVLDGARALRPGDTGELLQTDMALELTGTRVHTAIGREAARAAELLLRMSPNPRGAPHLDAYRRAFVARYGAARVVPLLELVDDELGLGNPAGRGASGPPSIDRHVAARREQALRELALDAQREHRHVVDLDDALMDALQTWTPAADCAPRTLELSVSVAATSCAAIDAGDFSVIVGPGLGASSAGRGLGRFADLLGAPALSALRTIAEAEAGLAAGSTIAEVVYQPKRDRSANVAIRPNVRGAEIAFSAPAGVPSEQVVPLDELVVSVRDGRFAIGWPAAGVEIIGVQGHMLNTSQAPAAARFLIDAANDGRCRLAPFDWGGASTLPFLPRVQRGRIILAAARWRVDVATIAASRDADEFAAALAAWRERWTVPDRVYLAASDNRLLLDLNDPEHAELLRQELRGLPAGRPALLQEPLPGPQDVWLASAGGGHMCELVVPLVLRESVVVPSTPVRATVPPAARLRLPGSDWLYLKLYGPRTFEDELIAGPLRSFCESATAGGLIDGWFFLRYTDPAPHLRVRFHGDPHTLLGPLMRQVCGWSTELVTRGSRTGYSFDTYDREVERYGGEVFIDLAEVVFAADSTAAAALVGLGRGGELAWDAITLALLSVDDLLDALGLDEHERLDLYAGATPLSRRDGAEYRRRQDQLRSLLGGRLRASAAPGFEAVADVLGARRLGLAPAASALRTLDRDARLLVPLAAVCRSFVHLHVNRLGATPSEQLILQLLHRTRLGLQKAPPR